MGTYMNDGLRKVDLVLVYKEEAKGKNDRKNRQKEDEKRQFFQQNLIDAGLQLEIDRVDDDRRVGTILTFVKIHAPWSTLCKYAEHLRIKTPLWITDKPVNTNKRHTIFVVESENEIPDQINSRKMKTNIKYQQISYPFKERHIERYAIKDKTKYFTELQRIEVAVEIVQKTAYNPKEPKQRGIERMLEEDVYECVYPLHDGDSESVANFDIGRIVGNSCDIAITHWSSERHRLKETWASWKNICRHQPLTEIRNYFGEKIGFYYAFMELYTAMLIFPTVVGLVTFAMGIIATADNPQYVALCKDEAGSSEGSKLTSVHQTKQSPMTDSKGIDIAQYWMCPVCKPPNCHPWQMGAEGCFYYAWSFRIDNLWSFMLSGFTAIWATVFLKLWKRREYALSINWDSHDVDEFDPVIRPQYEAKASKKRPNPITNQLEPHVPLSKKCFWMGFSLAATFLLLVFSCASVIILVVCRIYMYGLIRQIPGIVGEHNVTFARWIGHAMLFSMVTLLEKVYCRIARALTNRECPKTEKTYVTSLLWKIFVFVMLNQIIPIAYTAWVKGRTAETPVNMSDIDELCDYGCMGEITEVVAVLLLVRLVIGNTTEIGWPLLKHWLKRLRRRNNRSPEAEPIYNDDVESVDSNYSKSFEVPQYAKDYHLIVLEYDGVYEELMEMMVQFGFIAMFTPALPVVPLVCLLNNVAEIRVDAAKMINTSRRPLPLHTAGFGVWNHFLDIINLLGIAFNAALLAFTSDNVPYLFYRFLRRPKFDNGFIEFTLSKIGTSYFENEARLMFLERNITECWYPGFRQTSWPFEAKRLYWEITAFRIGVFSIYCIVLFTFVWLVNTFISDEPASVKTNIQRQKYIVKKSLDAEAEQKRKKSLATMSRKSKFP